MRFSIIILAQNAAVESLRETIAGISGVLDEYEIIIPAILPDGLREEFDAELREIPPCSSRTRAIQMAVAAAHGEYLLFVDAGDLPEQGWLKSIDTALKKSRADMVIFGFKAADGKTVLNPGSGIIIADALEDYKDASMRQGVSRRRGTVTLNGVHPALWNKCLRRELIAGIVNNADERLGGDVDGVVSYPALFAAKSVYAIADALYCRRGFAGQPRGELDEAYAYLRELYRAVDGRLARELGFLESYIARITAELLYLPQTGADRADFYLAAGSVMSDEWYEKSRRVRIEGHEANRWCYFLFRRGRWGMLYDRGRLLANSAKRPKRPKRNNLKTKK